MSLQKNKFKFNKQLYYGGLKIRMILDIIMNRRSIRKYKSENIPLEIINQILVAGRLAPSGKNRQPWRFIIFGGTNKSELLAEIEKGIRRESNEKSFLPDSRFGLPDAKNTLKIMKEAPIIIIVLNTNGKSPFVNISSDERFTEIVDSLSIGAAIENMLLQAKELGVGSLWIANTCFAYPEIQNYLNTSFQITGAIALGYSAENPFQRPRKTLSEIAEYRL